MTADVLALFDLDHTLVPHDSDEEWVAFVVDDGVLDLTQWEATNRELLARFNRGEAGAIEFTEFYLSTLARFDDAALERLDGRHTGRVAGVANQREGKVEQLLMFLAAPGERLTDFRETYAYCDSLNELPLMSQVSNPVAVNADPLLSAHARHMGWPVLQVS